MHKPIRMLDLIATFRAAHRPLTAAEIGARHQISVRTVYRDIAALQAMGVPIDGAAGLGYILRPGFHMPPLNFTPEEAEAITVGLALLGRTGDRGLTAAAASVATKIAAVQPRRGPDQPAALLASPWTGQPVASVDSAVLRRALREERILTITYRTAEGPETTRRILPLAMIYYVDATILAGYCELRGSFRHFRQDRILMARIERDHFRPRATALRRAWARAHPNPWTSTGTPPL